MLWWERTPGRVCGAGRGQFRWFGLSGLLPSAAPSQGQSLVASCCSYGSCRPLRSPPSSRLLFFSSLHFSCLLQLSHYFNLCLCTTLSQVIVETMYELNPLLNCTLEDIFVGISYTVSFEVKCLSTFLCN